MHLCAVFLIGGHLTTKWTKFYPLLPPHLFRSTNPQPPLLVQVAF